MIKKSQEKYFASLLALLIHLGFLAIFSWFGAFENKPSETNKYSSQKTIRTKLQSSIPIQPIKSKKTKARPRQKNLELDLSRLQIQSGSAPSSRYQKRSLIGDLSKKDKSALFEIKKKSKNLTIKNQNNQIRNQIVKNASSRTNISNILKNSQFDIHIEPIENLEKDELNSMDKTFYSFNRRVSINYIKSVLKTYHYMDSLNKNLDKSLKNSSDVLSARVTFDRLGNIDRIKILKSSNDDNIHNLFEQALRGMSNLPNPPSAFIKNRDFFSIYYQLRINK